MKKVLLSLRALSPDCFEASRWQSRSLDEGLPFSARVGLRVHLVLCRHCRRFARQTRLLHDAVQRFDQTEQTIRRYPLPPEARFELKARLRREMN